MSAIVNKIRLGMGPGTVSPAEMGAFAANNGYISDGGANAGLFTEGAARMGLVNSPLTGIDELRSSLLSGKPAILTGKGSGSATPYTNAGHIVVADGIIGNNVNVLDPITGKYKLYNINQVSRKTKHAWAYSAGYGPDELVSNENAALVEKEKKFSLMDEITKLSNVMQALFNSAIKGTTYREEYNKIVHGESSSGSSSANFSKMSASLNQFINAPNNIQEELLGKAAELIYHSESGGDYAKVTNDTGNTLSVGAFQANAGNAAALLRKIASNPDIPKELRDQLERFAVIGESKRRTTKEERSELSALLASPGVAEYVKAVTDYEMMSRLNNVFRGYFGKWYDNGTIKDLRTLPFLADWSNVGPAFVYDSSRANSFISNWTPGLTANGELSKVYNLMKSNKVYFGTKDYYANRMRHGYDSMNNYTIKSSLGSKPLSWYFAKDTNPLGFGPDDIPDQVPENASSKDIAATTTMSPREKFYEGLSRITTGLSEYAMRSGLGFLVNNQKSNTGSEDVYSYGDSNFKFNNNTGVLESLSGTDRERYLAAAKSQIGYLEKDRPDDLRSFAANPGFNSYTKYAPEMGGANGPGAHWCAYFTSWAAKAAGIPEHVVYRNANCRNIMEYYKSRGLFRYRDEYTAQPGDLVLFNSGWKPINDPRKATGSAHVGIVDYVSGDEVHTIEGNTPSTTKVNGKPVDAVAQKIRYLSKKQIVGFATPPWKHKQESVNPSEKLTTLGYGSPDFLSTSKIDAPFIGEQYRDSINNYRYPDESSINEKELLALGFGPGMKVDAGFDVSSTDSKLEKIFGVIAEWYESSKSKAAESSSTRNVNVINTQNNISTVNRGSDPVYQTSDIYRHRLITQHEALSYRDYLSSKRRVTRER